MTINLKLQLHLIPRSSFGSNLRNQMGRKWDTLSKQIRTERDFVCDICNRRKAGRAQTHLHEIWEYKNGIQKLIGFECVCATCHSVHHWGLSQIQRKDMNMLFNWACKINKCDRETFRNHIEESRRIWEYRSDQDWELDLSYLNTMGKVKGSSDSGLVIKMHRKSR